MSILSKIGAEITLLYRFISLKEQVQVRFFENKFPHFSKQILESLREPLEDNKILISRVNSKVEYQTKFLFAAAQNPCPCGNSSKNSSPPFASAISPTFAAFDPPPKIELLVDV